MAQFADAGSEPRFVCSECGLASNLEELARGTACPAWLIESSAGRHGVAMRFLHTVTRAFAAHRFWSAVHLAAPISWRGMILYLVGLALTLHLCAAAAITPVVLNQRNYAPATGSNIPDLALVAILPLCPMRADDILSWAAQGNPNRSVDGAVLWRFVTSAVQLTLARDKLVFERVPQSWNATGPYAQKQPPFFIPSSQFFVESDRNLLRAQRWLGAVLAVAAFPVVACALLALLPDSLRSSRVRRPHLLRGCVYACAFAPIALALNAAAQWIAVTADSAHPSMSHALRPVAIALMLAIPGGAIAFSAIHLDAFCTRYLVLPRGRAIATMLNLTVLLAAIVIGIGISNP